MAKKDEGALEREEMLDADHAEPRVYELGFHIDPELGAEEVKKTYQQIHDLIASVGTVVAEGQPEKVQLAYTISRSETTGRRDFTSAYFSWIAYETNGAGHDEVTAAARAQSRIIRLLDIRTTKDAAKHAAEMHEMLAKLPEAQETESSDDVSEVELDAALKEAGVS